MGYTSEHFRSTDPIVIKPGLLTFTVRDGNQDVEPEQQSCTLTPEKRKKLFGGIETKPMSKQTTT